MAKTKSEVGAKKPTVKSVFEQYRDLKKEHPDTLLLFRVGDFYELFHEDATTAARIVGLTLTTRQKASESPIPMCGFPFHQLEGYLRKLIQAGFRAAVCDPATE